MKKLILMLFLSVSILTAKETEDSLKQYTLGEIVVVGKNTELLKASSNVSIDSKEISRQDATSVDEIFSMQPGLYIRDNSRDEKLLYIRGFDQRQIAVFLDGAPIYIPNSGEVDLSQIPAGGLEKITVSKGMPSVLYGSNSMGGTVNILTREQYSGYSADAVLSTGTDRNSAVVNHGGTYRSFFWNLSADYTESPGFRLPENMPKNAIHSEKGQRDNSAYHDLDFYAKAGYKFSDESKLAATFFRVDNRRQVPVNIYSESPRYWRFDSWEQNLVNLTHQFHISDLINLRGNFYFNNFRNVLSMYDDSTYTTKNDKFSGVSTHNDDSYGANIITGFDFGFIPETKVSLAYKYDTHEEQANTGEKFQGYEAATMTVGLDQGYSPAGGLDLIAGFKYSYLDPTRADGFELQESKNSYDGYMGAAYEIFKNTSVYGNFSKNSRFPTLKEFYSNMRRSIANPGLAAEQAYNYEAGIKTLQFDGLRLHAAYFRSDIKSLIQMEFLEDGMRRFHNIGKALLSGIEFEAGMKTKYLNFLANYTYLDSKDESTPGNDILIYRPKHLANISLYDNYEMGFGWRAEFSYTGEQYGAHPDKASLYIKMPGYFLMNLRISQKLFKMFELFVRVNNLADRYYETYYGLPSPGREIIGGIKIIFDEQ